MNWQAEGWDQLREVLDQEECPTWDGFDDALVGHVSGIEVRAVYDVQQMIKILVERDKMDHDEAVEYLEFNVLGAYIGDKTPIHIYMDYDRVSKLLP